MIQNGVLAEALAEIERLQQDNAQMVAFIAAFELLLEDVGDGQFIHIEWHELKAQHGLAEEGNDE